jgi:hypothetical protein
MIKILQNQACRNLIKQCIGDPVPPQIKGADYLQQRMAGEPDAPNLNSYYLCPDGDGKSQISQSVFAGSF